MERKRHVRAFKFRDSLEGHTPLWMKGKLAEREFRYDEIVLTLKLKGERVFDMSAPDKRGRKTQAMKISSIYKIVTSVFAKLLKLGKVV